MPIGATANDTTRWEIRNWRGRVTAHRIERIGVETGIGARENDVDLRRPHLPNNVEGGASYYIPLPVRNAYAWSVEYCEIHPTPARRLSRETYWKPLRRPFTYTGGLMGVRLDQRHALPPRRYRDSEIHQR